MTEEAETSKKSSEDTEDIGDIEDITEDEKRPDRAAYWIRSAEKNLLSAKSVFSVDEWQWAAFLCHLIAEKALKAIIAKGGIFPQKIHALRRLAELGGIRRNLSKEQWQFLGYLMSFHIEPRYEAYEENVDMTLNREECSAILQKTEEFFLWIKNRLLL